MAVTNKTTMNQINTASMQANTHRIRNSALTVERFLFRKQIAGCHKVLESRKGESET
jgi:hypothetical protein